MRISSVLEILKRRLGLNSNESSNLVVDNEVEGYLVGVETESLKYIFDNLYTFNTPDVSLFNRATEILYKSGLKVTMKHGFCDYVFYGVMGKFANESDLIITYTGFDNRGALPSRYIRLFSVKEDPTTLCMIDCNLITTGLLPLNRGRITEELSGILGSLNKSDFSLLYGM